MRCKQGDLAKVTGGSADGNDCNLGKIVVVGERFDAHVLPLPSWNVQSLSAPLRCLDQFGRPALRPMAVCPDAWLTPINPPPDPESPPPDPESTVTTVKDERELVE